MNGKPSFRPRVAPMDRARAEAIAIEALSFLARSPERLALDISGLRPDTLRTAAQSGGFFAGLMDYLVSDEELLVAFAGEIGARPESVMEARRLLSPTELPD